VRRPHDRQTGLDIKGRLQTYPCEDTSLKKKRFQGRDAVGRQRRSALSLDAKFAPDSPLEGDGFEPSVPRQKDLCKHPRLPPIASTGGADRRENGEMPIWHRWVVSATAHPLRQIGQIGRVLRSPSRVRVA
jgi:hypothetical protein